MFNHNDSLDTGALNTARFAIQDSSEQQHNSTEANGSPYLPEPTSPVNGSAGESVSFENTHILSMHHRGMLSTRTAVFPSVTFSHITLPQTELCWDQKGTAADTATLTFQIQGRLEVMSSSSTVLTREPNTFLRLPGNTTITIKTSGHLNELVMLSIAPDLFSSAFPGYNALTVPSPESEIDMPTLQLLVSFAVEICNLSDSSVQSTETLGAVASEVAKALLTSCFGLENHQMSLLERVRDYVQRHYADCHLTVASMAQQQGVSTRTLQLALQAEDTSFTAVLRGARAQAANKLQREHPELTLNDIADRCGFGSVSSLRRALKTLD